MKVLRARSGAIRTDFGARIALHFWNVVMPSLLRKHYEDSFEDLTYRDHPLLALVVNS